MHQSYFPLFKNLFYTIIQDVTASRPTCHEFKKYLNLGTFKNVLKII